MIPTSYFFLWLFSTIKRFLKYTFTQSFTKQYNYEDSSREHFDINFILHFSSRIKYKLIVLVLVMDFFIICTCNLVTDEFWRKWIFQKNAIFSPKNAILLEKWLFDPRQSVSVRLCLRSFFWGHIFTLFLMKWIPNTGHNM